MMMVMMIIIMMSVRQKKKRVNFSIFLYVAFTSRFFLALSTKRY